MSGPISQRNHWLRVMASALLCMTLMSCSAMSNTGESESVPQLTKQETEKEALEPRKEQSIPAFTAPLTGLPVEATSFGATARCHDQQCSGRTSTGRT